MDAGVIDFGEYTERLEKLKAAMAELRAAREADAAKREGQSLTESMQTPEERAKAQIEKYKKLLTGGDIAGETYQRAVRKALEDAAAAMPDAMKRTIGVRGTFSALEAAGLGAGGATDRIANASEKTAKNTEKIAKLAEQWGVTFN
jgi:multidrug resistance efflux pump